MIASVTADLNSLGNPQIFKDPNTTYITIAKEATGVNILLVPTIGYNATNTETVNSSLISLLVSKGFSVTFNASTITIESSSLVTSVLSSYIFDIRNNINVNIGSDVLNIEILNPEFVHTQTRCKYCSNFNPIENSTTSQNIPIANRGKIEYIFVDVFATELSLATGNYNETTSYCWCGAAENLLIKSILTIRQIPNCGGTSPIVFQAIDETTIDILEITPSIQYEADFNCCVSEDEAVEVNPVAITLNVSDTGINDGCETGQLSLKYDLFNPDGDEVVIIESKTGTISTSTASKNFIGTGTSFTSQLVIGSKVYDEDDNYIGTVEIITDNTNGSFVDNSLYTKVNIDYKSNKYYFATVNTSSSFDYTSEEKGTFLLRAILENCCKIVTKEWSINICNSWLLITGTCNNPVVKNISATNFLKFTLKTYNGVNLIDNVTNTILFEDELVSPLSEIELGVLQDGFYILTVQYLNTNGTVLTTTEQILFYDCYIKTCEFELTNKPLAFCDDCGSQEEKNKWFYERSRFETLKNGIYSYWNIVKKEQSVPSSWDIENHLTKLARYSDYINQLKALCGKCENNNTYNTSIVYSKSNPCGCN